MLSLSEELKEIASHTKRLLTANAEMGLDPPRVSIAASEPSDNRPAIVNTREELRDFIGDCRRCKLWQGRTHLVFGEGNPRARLVFIGEGPGKDEDLEGRPFVGEAGKLLSRIVKNGMGLEREEVYICNVVKCRPPNNRVPERDEVEACLPFLKRQLEIIGPEVICALGLTAAQNLLGRPFAMNRERGSWVSYRDVPVMPTYHPAYLLRNPSAKRQVWEDVQKIMKLMGLEVKGNG
jgi:uracil-DNA glycosylase family 4